MKNFMRKWSIICLAVLLSIFAGGCEGETEPKGENSSLILQQNGLLDCLALYDQQLLYMEVEDNGDRAYFYVYDFKDGTTERIGYIDDFLLMGSSKVCIDGILYFYLTTQTEGQTENLFCAVDFASKKIDVLSRNLYNRKLIPVVEYDKSVMALQGNLSGEDREIFAEFIDKTGSVKPVSDNGNMFQNVLNIDSYKGYIYAVSQKVKRKTVDVFQARYDADFYEDEKVSLSDLLKASGIEGNIGTYYAFGSCFYIMDPSNYAVIYKINGTDAEIIMAERNLEYVYNSCDNDEFEYFYKWETNDLYKLDTKKGTIEQQNFDTDNDDLVIQCAFRYDDQMAFIKTRIDRKNRDKYVYYIELDKN